MHKRARVAKSTGRAKYDAGGPAMYPTVNETQNACGWRRTAASHVALLMCHGWYYSRWDLPGPQ